MLNFTLLHLLIAGLATWRMCSLVMYEDGPFGIFMHLRTAAIKSRFAAELINCIYCVSVWVGVAVTIIAISPIWLILLPFAFSTVAILVHKHVYVNGSRH